MQCRSFEMDTRCPRVGIPEFESSHPSHAVGLWQVRSPAIVNVGGKIAVETIGMRPGKTRALSPS
jgi:hypothetical protein